MAKENLTILIAEVVPNETYTVQIEAIESSSPPFVITFPEFIRSMKAMQNIG